MKPIPIAIGSVATMVVVVAILVFLLLGGDDEPGDTLATPSDKTESVGDQDTTPPATQSTGLGSETDLESGDQAALMAIYHAAGGPNWNYPQANPNVHWTPENPLERWYGIRLDGSGRVSEVVLYQMSGVVGHLAPEIGNLTGLQSFTIENAELSGSLPTQIGNLVNLEILDLSDNQLSGSLPPEIGNLANLRTIDLSGNQLSGPLVTQIGNLSSIETLNLSANQLSGPLPSEIGNLVALKVLDLHGNPFSGEIPSEFANLTNLERLALSGHQLTGCIPAHLPRSAVQYVQDLSPCSEEGQP